MIYHQLWYIGREPFLGPLSFLCPIEKIWRIDCHNFPTKGTNKINIFVLIIVKIAKEENYHWHFAEREHFIALHLSLYWTSCHKSHLNSKERGHKDENWKATHPTFRPKLPKCSLRRRCSGCSLVAGGQLATGALSPSLKQPPYFPSLSLTNSWFSTWQPTSHPTPEMK